VAKEVEVVCAERDKEFVHDPRGFFVILLDADNGEIVVEHYENVKKDGVEMDAVTGKLALIVRGKDAESVSQTLLRRGYISRLDHANYLGRELQKAEECLKRGEKYVQDD
jgi:dihydropteroate synthase